MKIVQAFTFEAAHRLPRVPQTHRCSKVHGHSYRVELELEGEVDKESGLVVDFFDVESTFQPLLEQLDHQLLNDVEGLDNPTSENIAMWIWNRAAPALPQLSRIVIHETDMCRVEYDGR
jgi:6-pyruvoyltetrahydropterin/6-carboxytetrahydropterin synthase